MNLLDLGLHVGDRVRFRRRDDERWKDGVVARLETDGSIGLHDRKGASRAIPIERLEVRTKGPRGGVVWVPLTAQIGNREQLALFP